MPSPTKLRPFGHVRVPFKRIHIELTNICDFDCVFCPKSLMQRKYGHMDPNLAKRALDEIKEHGLAEKVTFHVMGEPTLYKHFWDVMDHARDIGMPVGLTTNAGGLGGPVGERLLDYDLYQLDASLQTPDEASFTLRKAGKLEFQDYLDGILGFFTRYRPLHPDTIFKFRFLNTIFPPKSLEKRHGPIRVMSSSRELRETFGFWIAKLYDMLGMDQASRDQAVKRLKSLKAWKWNVVEVLPKTFFETYILADWGHAFDKDVRVRDAWAGDCFGMRDHFAVLWNGDVVLCCIDFDGNTAVANLEGSSLEAILSSDDMGTIMRGFKRMRPTVPYCRRCLGSTSFFSWLTKPVVHVAGLKLLKPYFYKTTKLF